MSRLFQSAENIKCRRISLKLISWGPDSRLDRESTIRRRLFTSSIKRKIRHFHVVVAQWWLRNARAKLLLCLTNPFLFLAFSLPSPSSLLKLPEQSKLPKATTQNAKAYENRTRSWSFTKIGQGREFLVPNLLHKLRTIPVVPCCHWSSPYGLWARSIQPKFPEISVQNSVDRFGPTGKVSKKLAHLFRWTTFPGRTGRNFGWMDRALCLSGEGHKAKKETMPCLRGCLQEVKNNVKRLFQLCFNHDIFTKPTHQNDDKLPVNGYSKSRHLLHCK